MPSETHNRKLKPVISRILVVYEKQHVHERNPLALQVSYESISQPIRYQRDSAQVSFVLRSDHVSAE
jgi:hypothetical protein